MRIFIAILWLLLTHAALAQPLPGPVPAEVLRVVDGDTIEVRAHIWPGHSVITRVRLANIDAAETWRPSCEAERKKGEAATRFVEDSLPQNEESAPVSLHEIRPDSFAGRVIARMELPDGRDLGALLLETGHARPFRPRPDWCALEDLSG